MTHRRSWVGSSVRVGRPSLSAALELGEPAEWTLDALCAQVDPELWFPDKGGSTGDAKRICMECPVRAECLQYALDHEEIHGVWGAKSYRERLSLRPITSEEGLRQVAEVQRLAAEGWSTIAIALELGISEWKVRDYRKRPLGEHLEAS